jgi:predicted transcriptional regulator
LNIIRQQRTDLDKQI